MLIAGFFQNVIYLRKREPQFSPLYFLIEFPATKIWARTRAVCLLSSEWSHLCCSCVLLIHLHFSVNIFVHHPPTVDLTKKKSGWLEDEETSPGGWTFLSVSATLRGSRAIDAILRQLAWGFTLAYRSVCSCCDRPTQIFCRFSHTQTPRSYTGYFISCWRFLRAKKSAIWDPMKR